MVETVDKTTGESENNRAKAKLAVQRTLVYAFMIILTFICKCDKITCRITSRFYINSFNTFHR